MQTLVETTGDFLLLDPLTGDMIDWNRPCVVTWSSFLEGRAGSREIRLIANLKDEATDQEYVEYLKASKGKADLALESFLSAFESDEPSAEKKVDSVQVTKAIGRKK